MYVIFRYLTRVPRDRASLIPALRSRTRSEPLCEFLQGGAELPNHTKIGSLGVGGKLVYASAPTALPALAGFGASAGAGSGASGGSGAASGTVPAAPAASTSGASSSSSAAAAAPPRVVTPLCAHGPRGACPHCLPPSDDDYKAPKLAPLNKAVGISSAAGASTVRVGDEAQDMEWLCRHAPHQMCPNCAPLEKGEKVELSMLCQHEPHQMCTNCLPPDSVIVGRKHSSYGEWVESLRALCSHSFGATCIHCAPPTSYRYKLKLGCARHKAWPAGVCFEWCESHVLRSSSGGCGCKSAAGGARNEACFRCAFLCTRGITPFFPATYS